MAVSAELRVIFGATQTGSNDFGGPTFDLMIDKIMQFASGTGANQADIVWADERTIAASSSEDLDLAGVLADAFGATVAAAEVVAILVIADAANTNNVVIGDATSPIPLFGGTNPTHAVKPGGVFFAAAPNAAGLLTVGAGSTDDLKVANSSSGTGVTYKIAILARSA
jgi:hypothetical protein